MKVHFVTSKPSLEKDIETLRRIIKVVKTEGHVLARDWIESAYDSNRKTGRTADDWVQIYTENIGVIAGADVIIAEASYENFGVGYMIATAVQQKKPVLLLRHQGIDEGAFAMGVVDNWVRREEYTSDKLETIVASFLRENDITTKDMRFNFFIDRAIYNYLRWAALKTGKTKAEVLRELVQREIKEKDY